MNDLSSTSIPPQSTRRANFSYLARRLAAYMIDVVLLALAVPISQAVIWWLTAGRLHQQLTNGWQIEGWLLLSVSLPVWCYFVLSDASASGATVGKRWLGVGVTDLAGQPLALGPAVLRTALKLLPWELNHMTLLLPTPIWSSDPAEFRLGFALIYLLLALWIAPIFLTSRRQSLPDWVAGALVSEQKR